MLIIFAIIGWGMAIVYFLYLWRGNGEYRKIALVMACLSAVIAILATGAIAVIEGNIGTIRTLSALSGKDCTEEILEMYKKLYFWYW